MIRKIQILLIFALFPVIVFSQDMMYSQFYANPTYLNPALTGNTMCSRVNLQYRNQWPSLQNAFVNYYASYDQYFESVGSGFGLMANNESEGNGVLQTTTISGLYAYHFAIDRNWSASAGIQFTYGNRMLGNLDELVFGDQLNINDNPDFLPASDEPLLGGESKSYSDISFGSIVGYDERFYLGFAAHHLLQPNISLMAGGFEQLPIRYTVHSGAIISLPNGLYSKEDVYLSPNVLYAQQGKFHQLNAGLYVAFPYIILGTWFRHNFENPDAIIVLVGIKQKNFKFGYSYDIGVSGALPGISGAHELSVSYTFCVYREKSKRFKAIKCPTF